MPCPNYRRKRTISKAFRVSPEENERIELLSKAAGVTQQEYIMTKLENKEFTIVPDVRTYKMLRDEMARVYRELRRIRSAGEVDEGLAWTVDFLAREFSAMRGEEEPSDVEREDALIFGMSRR